MMIKRESVQARQLTELFPLVGLMATAAAASWVPVLQMWNLEAEVVPTLEEVVCLLSTSRLHHFFHRATWENPIQPPRVGTCCNTSRLGLWRRPPLAETCKSSTLTERKTDG